MGACLAFPLHRRIHVEVGLLKEWESLLRTLLLDEVDSGQLYCVYKRIRGSRITGTTETISIQ